jgi:NAD(P)-dependent dehydrogenase (short-subunit alcohol dehydrogenase family)
MARRKRLKDFNGKVVVVTGAANGIGREIARAFARRGAKLAIADIDTEGLQDVRDELASLGCEAYNQTVDVSVSEQVKDFCNNVYRKMARVDVLCNNAGVAVGGDFENISLEDLEWIVGVNLMGVVHGCHFFYPRMIEQGGGGHIVNTASAAGLGPFPGLTAYGCTKYGVVGLSETLRAEAALHGIGVSVICPGVIATDIVKRSKITSGSDRSTPEEIASKLDTILNKRGYTPDRVAAAVVKAVERNKGVLPVTPEAHLLDLSHRLSRRSFDLMAKIATRMARKVL